MSTYLHTLLATVRAAVADYREAVTSGFDADLVIEFGDIADDLIDDLCRVDTGMASRFAAAMAKITAEVA